MRIERGPRLAALALICIVAGIRVAATHRVFSGTLDEPVHIAAGYAWWHGGIALDPEHPPLARMLIGLPLRSLDPPESDNREGRGTELLEKRGQYVRTLAAARRGNLLFLLIAIVATYAWGRRLGDEVALLAAALGASLPPLLGHAGLATTDMALAAMLPVALLALDAWLAQPIVARAAVLGLAAGLAALAKYSFVLFFPVMAAVLIAFRWRDLRAEGRRGRQYVSYLLSAAVAIMVVWAGFRFEFGTLADAYHGHVDITSQVPALLQRPFGWFSRNVPVPAPLFFDGMALVSFHNGVGHASYLLGEVRNGGWWYYFPVVFFFKTPLPFLILAACGAIVMIRKRIGIEVLAMALALMLSVLPSAINIGIRHILPIYPLLCVIAAYGATQFWRGRMRIAIAALLAWLFAGVALAHPDYLAWFNEAAGAHPDRIAVDSNLDWGQDVSRLARVVRRRHIDAIHVNCLTTVDFRSHGVPAEGLQPDTQTRGWIAVSETALRLDPKAQRGGYRWLDAYEPVERVGRSIRLYYVP
ncbi:MAG: hypothetical protein JWO56_291 [Acidobacteria bacterium]|nr:hypothetical protein [Acidobacteriota bacterium]